MLILCILNFNNILLHESILLNPILKVSNVVIGLIQITKPTITFFVAQFRVVTVAYDDSETITWSHHFFI